MSNRSLITDEQAEQFREQGYFITPPMFEPKLLDAVAAESERLWKEEVRSAEAGGEAHLIDIARHRPFLCHAHAHSEVLRQFVKAPIYLEACAKFIGPDADMYFNQVVIKPPETGKHFGWHQDSGYTITRPLEYITCWTAISRAFIENGCVWLIPGSHQRGLVEHRFNEAESSNDAVFEDQDGALPVELEPGQVAIFSSLILHKSGANTSNEIRLAYVPQYHVSDVVRVDDGSAFGDQFPVLRRGQPV